MQFLDINKKMPIEYLLSGVSDATFIQVLKLHISAGFEVFMRPSEYTPYLQGSALPEEVLFGSNKN